MGAFSVASLMDKLFTLSFTVCGFSVGMKGKEFYDIYSSIKDSKEEGYSGTSTANIKQYKKNTLLCLTSSLFLFYSAIPKTIIPKKYESLFLSSRMITMIAAAGTLYGIDEPSPDLPDSLKTTDE